MQVQEVMTRNPACCSADTSLQDVARMMVDCNCGEIPVLDEMSRPVGVVTDRDICCRAVARGLNPQSTNAREVMSSPVVTVRPDDSLETCCQKMEDNQVRRVPVVDDNGSCCGIVAQADIARRLDEHATAEVVRDISQPSSQSAH